MCFRPADASAGAGVNRCPECGKIIQTMGGIELKSCPFCKADLTAYLDGSKPIPSSPAVSGKLRAPKAPGAPAAPKEPGAPM